MIKGAHRQIIVIRTASSRYFDEAHFVLRREHAAAAHEKNDILKEANRILSDSIEHTQKRSTTRRMGALLFGAGALFGALLTLALCLLLF